VNDKSKTEMNCLHFQVCGRLGFIFTEVWERSQMQGQFFCSDMGTFPNECRMMKGRRTMIYKKVAKIQEEISAIGVGCWGFGGDFDSTNDGKTRDIVMAAVNGGINFFDVAPVYGWGHSEEMLGSILKEEGIRSKVLIATKGGLRFNDRHETTNNLSRQSLLWEVD